MGYVSPTLLPLGLFIIRMLGLVMINIYAKVEVSVFTHYSNTNGNAICIKHEKSHMKRLAIVKRPSKTLNVIAIR